MGRILLTNFTSMHKNIILSYSDFFHTLPTLHNHLMWVGCFQPFKLYHKEEINNAMQSSEGDFGKLEFLAKFQTMRNKTFKKSTIKLAFKNTGLIPYNPEVVL